MKKFMVTFMMMLVSMVAMAIDSYKVKFVKIGNYDRGTTVICTSGKCFTSVSQRQYTSFFNSLRAGDIIEVEEYENKILGIRKIGYERPEGMTNGVIVDGASNYGGYGYYGGGYGSANIETKNFGVGYDPYTGVSVRIGSSYVNLPVRIKSKKTNNNYTTVNNGGVVTASPATQVVTVNANDLSNNNSSVRTNATTVRKAAARTTTITTTTSTTTSTATTVKTYTGSVAGMF